MLTFLSFLSKENILNDSAKKEAYEYLQLSRKQRIIEESISPAKRLLESNYLLTPIDALKQIVKEKGINISTEEAIEFL
ncbi:MAG: hypothetical protein AB8B69_05845 [Chitinophagales bacterium]